VRDLTLPSLDRALDESPIPVELGHEVTNGLWDKFNASHGGRFVFHRTCWASIPNHCLVEDSISLVYLQTGQKASFYV
jgi:hypothetical protein